MFAYSEPVKRWWVSSWNLRPALGATKKIGKFIYFAVDGVDVEVSEAHRNGERVARKWVVEYNKEVAKLRASDPVPAGEPVPAPADDSATALEKLAGLHDSGPITDDEAKRRDHRPRGLRRGCSQLVAALRYADDLSRALGPGHLPGTPNSLAEEAGPPSGRAEAAI